MNHDFKLNFDDGTEDEPKQVQPDDVVYPQPGQSRNLSFKWPDGRRLFLSYSYLVSCECTEHGTTLLLAFTTHLVTVKGMGLEELYDALMMQQARILECADSRYNQIQEEDNAPVINEILVTVIGG